MPQSSSESSIHELGPGRRGLEAAKPARPLPLHVRLLPSVKPPHAGAPGPPTDGPPIEAEAAEAAPASPTAAERFAWARGYSASMSNLHLLASLDHPSGGGGGGGGGGGSPPRRRQDTHHPTARPEPASLRPHGSPIRGLRSPVAVPH
jgi:hypothetical protein